MSIDDQRHHHPLPTMDDSDEDRERDARMIMRHATLMDTYRSSTSAEVLQDIYFLSQIALFKQHMEEMHHRATNPSCVCRTSGCGHRADVHEHGTCMICQKNCWS